jgi:hypothetical protein
MFRNNRIPFVKFIAAVALSVLACLSAQGVSAATSDARKSPEAVATEFYTWYVKTIAGHKDPMTDYPDELAEFVSKPLISEVRGAMAKEGGLEADYFIQAQDYLEDWPTNVRATKSKIKGSTATLELTLGASRETEQKLTVTMTKEKRNWKIRNVRPLE